MPRSLVKITDSSGQGLLNLGAELAANVQGKANGLAIDFKSSFPASCVFAFLCHSPSSNDTVD